MTISESTCYIIASVNDKAMAFNVSMASQNVFFVLSSNVNNETRLSNS